MAKKFKSAEQFVKDHQEWLELFMNTKGIRAISLWDERPEGKDYNLINADLVGLDCRFADLRDADLTHANLTHANLRNSNLEYANLTNINFSFADLTNADLTNADLSKAILTNAILTNAKLSFAKLNNADLSYANLTDAGLEGAGLFGAKIDMKWKNYISKENVRGFKTIDWIERYIDEKLDKYMEVVNKLKENGLSNNQIMEIIDLLEK